MSERRRVLMLAYFFPPLGGAGVQRVLKFVKYLPQHGWDPIVVTTDSLAYPVADPTLAMDIPPGIRVIRAHELTGPSKVLRAASLIPVRPVAAALSWPDNTLGWVPAAARATVTATERFDPSVIFSTSSPYSTHIAALLAAARTGVPWVADFRDEWSHNPYLSQLPHIAGAGNRLAERRVLARASAVVRAAAYFRFADPVWDQRAITIPNGVDEADFSGPAPSRDHERFRITYVGTLYGKRDAKPVMRALTSVLSGGVIEADRLELRAVGNIWSRLDAPRGLHVTSTGYVSHEDAVAEMRSADVLLLYEPPESMATTGKLFEYLASGRPVLCVAPRDGHAARLVSELNAGVVADPEDERAIADAMVDLQRRWASGDLGDQTDVSAAVLSRFSRRRLAGRLADVLDDVSARPLDHGDAVRAQQREGAQG